MADRLEILKIHAARSKLAPDVNLERLSQLTVGHSGAELANLLNEAAIIAVQDTGNVITNAHVEQARDRILLGRVRSGMVISDHERRLIALPTADHASAAAWLRQTRTAARVCLPDEPSFVSP